MDLGLTNKFALVTAASKGLGRASAAALAQEGARVAICARQEETLRRTAAEIGASTGAEILAIPADLSQKEDIDRLVGQVLHHFGGLHILVTNAGGPPAGYFEEFDDQQWQSSFNLTMMSAVRLIRAAIPPMKQQQWGRIINITSLSVKEPIENLILSNSIRAGVHGLAKTLAGQLAQFGITVNNVMPGTIHTDRIDQLAQHRAGQTGQSVAEALAGMGQVVPLGRIGRPEELGALVAFLASERASYINGASIPVDGGRLKSTF